MISLMISLLAIPITSHADVVSSLEGHWAAELIDNEFVLKYFSYFNNEEISFNPSEPMKISDFENSLTMLTKDYQNTEIETEDTEKENIEEETITRIEAVRIILSSYDDISLNNIEVVEENSFTDLHELEENDVNSILKAHKLGIINGYPDGTFKPGNSVSQIEGILLLQRLKESLDLKTTSIPFKVTENNKCHSGLSEGICMKDLEDKVAVTVTKKFSTSGYKMNIDRIERSEDNIYNIYLGIDQPKPDAILLQVITYQSITIEIDKSHLQGTDYTFGVKTLGLDIPIENNKAEY